MAFSFGQPAAPAASTSTPSFSFGGAAQQPQQQQQQQQPQQNAGGLGFSFGAPNSNTGNAQGSSNTQQAGSSLFGNSQQQQQPQGGTSLFGQPSSAPTSLFGQSQQQQPASQGSSSLFGKPIGSTQTSSLFGNQQQQPQQQQQAPAAQPFSIGSLGATAPYNQPGQPGQANRPGQGGLFGAGPSGSGANAANTQGTQQDLKRLGVPINDKLEAVRAGWDMQNIQTCQFLHYFYNALPSEPSNIGEMAVANPNFGRRHDAVGPRHDALWLQTLRENPDRSKLVPVLAVGFPDLKSRIEAQQAETSRQSAKLTELQKRLDDLNSKHSLSNSVRISAISRKQTSLHQRTLGLAKRIHLLIPALRGHSVTANEEQLKSLLHACEMELASISSMSMDGSMGASSYDNGFSDRGQEDKAAMVHHRLRGRINELWALLGTVKAKREASAMTGERNRLEWAVVDESAVEDVVKILAAQQQGLDHLSTTLQSDTHALNTIVKGLEGVELIGTK